MFTISLFAKKVDIENAKNIAKNHYVLTYENTMGKTIEYPTIMESFSLTKENETVIYIFNFDIGFSIVSADDAVIPILGYSFEGKFNTEDHPPALIELLEHYKDQINYAINNNLETSEETQFQWSYYSNMENAKEGSECEIWPKYLNKNPMLSTIWEQKCYYNDKCPYDDYIVTAMCCCSHVWAGCVAVAMAQIMKYWNYPVSGIGSHQYIDGAATPDAYGTQSADFGNTTYNWNEMPDELTAGGAGTDGTRSSSNEIDAVSTLIYHCGVSVEMDYGYSGSYTWSSDTYKVADSYENYFNYASSAEHKEKSNYTESSWESLLRNNLSYNKPIYYQGQNNTGIGHAFVLDGYTKMYTESLTYYAVFHINWGYEDGGYNGYFYLSDLTPGVHNLNYYQEAIVGITPPDIIHQSPPQPSYISEPACYPHCSNVEVEYFVPTVEEATSYEWSLTGLITADVTWFDRYATVWSHKSGTATLSCRALNHGVPGPWQSKTIYIEKCDKGSESSINESNSYQSKSLFDDQIQINRIEVQIYPNPAKNNIQITLLDSRNHSKVELINSQFEVVKSVNIEESSLIMSTVGLKNGIYILRITSTDNIVLKKVIISK